jgi:hypothetical protein
LISFLDQTKEPENKEKGNKFGRLVDQTKMEVTLGIRLYDSIICCCVSHDEAPIP